VIWFIIHNCVITHFYFALEIISFNRNRILHNNLDSFLLTLGIFLVF